MKRYTVRTISCEREGKGVIPLHSLKPFSLKRRVNSLGSGRRKKLGRWHVDCEREERKTENRQKRKKGKPAKKARTQNVCVIGEKEIKIFELKLRGKGQK